MQSQSLHPSCTEMRRWKVILFHFSIYQMLGIQNFRFRRETRKKIGFDTRWHPLLLNRSKFLKRVWRNAASRTLSHNSSLEEIFFNVLTAVDKRAPLDLPNLQQILCIFRDYGKLHSHSSGVLEVLHFATKAFDDPNRKAFDDPHRTRL